MPFPNSRGLIPLIVLAFTAVLSPVSMDMVTPSLTGLAQGLDASPRIVELTLYSFLVGYGVSPSVWGVLSDRVGRRPVMFIGMAIYCCSSLAGATAADASDMILVRFIQGVGAGAGATVARAAVRDIYGAAGTTQGMAQMISVMAVVPFLMPLAGGVLASAMGWRACFIAMSLIGLISVIAYWRWIPETRPRTDHSITDSRSSVLTVLKHPVFAQHAFCNMFCISILVIFGANFSFITSHHFDFGSGSNGIVLALFNGSIAIGTYLARHLMRRLGAHRAILVGTASATMAAMSIALLASTGHAAPGGLAPLLTLGGMGCGVIMALCSGAALTPFAHQSGVASSVYLLLQSAGSSAISLLVGLYLPKELLPMAVAMAICGLFAMTAKILLARRMHPSPK